MDEKRNQEIYNMRLKGKKLKEIAEVMNISTVRVRQIYLQEKWRLEEKDDPECWWFGLSSRTANALKNAELEGKEDVLRALKLGRINPRPNGTKGYGWKSHKEVHAWLGLPEPQKQKRVCPHCGGEL